MGRLHLNAKWCVANAKQNPSYNEWNVNRYHTVNLRITRWHVAKEHKALGICGKDFRAVLKESDIFPGSIFPDNRNKHFI